MQISLYIYTYIIYYTGILKKLQYPVGYAILAVLPFSILATEGGGYHGHHSNQFSGGCRSTGSCTLPVQVAWESPQGQVSTKRTLSELQLWEGSFLYLDTMECSNQLPTLSICNPTQKSRCYEKSSQLQLCLPSGGLIGSQLHAGLFEHEPVSYTHLTLPTT